MARSFADAAAGVSPTINARGDDAANQERSPRVVPVRVPDTLVPGAHLPDTFRLVLQGRGAANVQVERLGALLIGRNWLTLDAWRTCRYYRLHNPTLRFLGLHGIEHNMVHGMEDEFVLDANCPDEPGTIRVEEISKKETRVRLEFVPPAASYEYVKTIMEQAGLQVIKMERTKKRYDMWEGTVKNPPAAVPHYLEGETIAKGGPYTRRKEILVTVQHRKIECYYCGETTHWSNKCSEALEKKKRETRMREQARNKKSLEKQLEDVRKKDEEEKQRRRQDEEKQRIEEENRRIENEKKIAEKLKAFERQIGSMKKAEEDRSREEDDSVRALVIDDGLDLQTVTNLGDNRGASSGSTPGKKAKAGSPGAVKTPRNRATKTKNSNDRSFNWASTPDRSAPVGIITEEDSLSADRQFLSLQGDAPARAIGKGEWTLRRSLFPTPKQSNGEVKAAAIQKRTPKRDSDAAKPISKRRKAQEVGNGKPKSGVEEPSLGGPRKVVAGSFPEDGDGGGRSTRVTGSGPSSRKTGSPQKSVPKFKVEPVSSDGGTPRPGQVTSPESFQGFFTPPIGSPKGHPLVGVVGLEAPTASPFFYTEFRVTNSL